MLSVLVRRFPSLFVYAHITFKTQHYFLLQYFQLITDLENEILSLCYQHRKPYSLLGDREDRAQLFSILYRVTWMEGCMDLYATLNSILLFITQFLASQAGMLLGSVQTPVERVAFVFVRVCLWNLFVWMIAEYCTGSGVRCTCVLLSLRSVGCVFV